MSITDRRALYMAMGVLAWSLASVAPVTAQNNSTGLYIPVPSPITTDAFIRIKSQVVTHLEAPNSRSRPTAVIFDFTPEGKAVATSQIGACIDLAYFIQGIQASTTTVAFVHGKVSGFTVLPVITCRELVMGKDGLLGEVVGENVNLLREPDKAHFRNCFSRDPLFPLIQKMYDREVVLRKGQNRQTGATQYVDARDKAALAGLVAPQAVPGAQDGQFALYNPTTAREVGLCKATAESPQQVAELYGFTLTTDVLGGRQPEAFQWALRGEVDASMRDTLKRVIRELRAKNGNILILTLMCGGNDLIVARGIADDLRAVENASIDDARILVVGFIPEVASAAATVIALGCTDIVMTKPRADNPEGREAEIGDFEGYLRSLHGADSEPARLSVRDLAESQGYPGILIDGMFKKDIEIVRATEKTNKLVSRLMTRDELEKSRNDWNEDSTIKPKGQYLKLKATRASEVGLARYLVDDTDPRALAMNIYGAPEVRDLEPGWLDRFADFLRQPIVTVLLVVLGFTGLILELKMPGLTFPGIIAALCFILVFWSNSRFSGQTFVLALLLFLLGLVLIGLEIFVLPGFGACGIFGIMCMLAGLGLVSLDRIPETIGEWGRLGEKVSWYLFAMIGSMVLSFSIARYLPKMPYANRLVLMAPADGGETVSALPGAVEAAEMLGAIGTTNTSLRPAGVVRVGDKFVDVVSDGGFIPAGTRVQVIQVEGTRIVVKEV